MQFAAGTRIGIPLTRLINALLEIRMLLLEALLKRHKHRVNALGVQLRRWGRSRRHRRVGYFDWRRIGWGSRGGIGRFRLEKGMPGLGRCRLGRRERNGRRRT